MGASAKRVRDKRERRGAILDAAQRVFGDKGAHNATMDDVAEAAQVSKGTVYLYFEGKDDLLVALAHRPLDVVLERFETLLADEHADGLTLLNRMLTTHSEVVDEHAADFRLAIATMSGDLTPDPGSANVAHYRSQAKVLRESYLSAIRRGMRDGSLRADLDPELVGGALWAGMFGAMFLRINAPRFQAQLDVDHRTLDFDAVLPTLQELLLSALMPNKNEEEEA